MDLCVYIGIFRTMLIKVQEWESNSLNGAADGHWSRAWFQRVFIALYESCIIIL